MAVQPGLGLAVAVQQLNFYPYFTEKNPFSSVCL